MNIDAANDADADFSAALHEVENNVEVRRLMVVLSNVLTPACVMAVTDAMAGADPSPALRWLPPLVMPLCGSLLLASGFLVTGVVARCHFGLVVNGTKLRKVETGTLTLSPLNWLGVTTNFLALTASSAALGAIALAASCGLGVWSFGCGAATLTLMMLWLPVSHHRANRRCRELDAHWQHAEPSPGLRREHARRSLDSTTADIAVVVVMAVALFAGVFNALSNLGAIADSLDVRPTPTTIKHQGPPLLLSFLLLSLLLTCRILVRLRIAFGEHARRLAELRTEIDRTAMLWRPQERTYLLYTIVLGLAAASALMLGIQGFDHDVGFVSGGVVLLLGAIWYPWMLRAARREHARAAQRPVTST